MMCSVSRKMVLVTAPIPRILSRKFIIYHPKTIQNQNKRILIKNASYEVFWMLWAGFEPAMFF